MENTKLSRILLTAFILLLCVMSANAQTPARHTNGTVYGGYASEPITPTAKDGQIYYNNVTKLFNYFNGTVWAPLGISNHEQLTNIGTKTHVALEDILGYGNITSIKVGGHLTPNTNTALFDLEDGSGCIVDKFSDPDNPTITLISWSGLTGVTPTYIGSTNLSFIAIQESGVAGVGEIVQQATDFTRAQRRDLIIIGELVHTNNVNITTTTDDSSESTSSYLLEDFLSVFGDLNVFGNNLNEASTDLSVRKEAGESFLPNINKQNDIKNPNFLTSGVLNPMTFLYIYDDGSGGITVVPSQTLLDPDQYDDKDGTLGSVANNKWTNQHFYFFPASGVVLIRYGETIFDNLTAAENAIFNIPSTIGTGLTPDLIRTVISMKKGATDASSALVIFTPTDQRGLAGSGGGSGGSGGVTQDLQDTYNNSINPEITTDLTRGAVTIQRGTSSDSDTVLEVNNGAGSTTFSVTGAGDITANNLSGSNTGDNAVNSLYSGLVTNQTHTGDVTGSGLLTIAAGAVDIPMLSATGTPSNLTYLRGDGIWSGVSGGTQNLQDVTDLGNTTTLNIDALSFNDLILSSPLTGAVLIGTDAGGGTATNKNISIGWGAGENDTGAGTMSVGQFAGQHNTGINNTLLGNGAGRANVGGVNTYVGFNSGMYGGWGSNTAVGYYSGRLMLGRVNSVLGDHAFEYSESSFSTALGASAGKDFQDDTANDKDIATPTTDVNVGLNQITITAHGFTSNLGSDRVNLRYTTTGGNLGGFLNNSIYVFDIVDANTLEPVSTIMSGTPTDVDTHTFAPQFIYDNVSLIGYNAQPTASNQIVLGDANVTQVVMGDGTILGGSGSGLTVLVTTSTALDLSSIVGNLVSMASANSATTYTFTGAVTNGYAQVRINAASEPTVTSATKTNGADFIVSTDMYLVVWHNGTTTQYYFLEI